jgi:glycosyltransferase involved in cell wall biosynthesis
MPLQNSAIHLVMVVRNVEPKIELFTQVLSSASRVTRELYIIDHGSTDGSIDQIKRLSKEYNFKLHLFQEPFEGTMDEIKWKYVNEIGLQIAGDHYILLLDWDEVISDDLAIEINELDLKRSLYMIDRQTFFLGKIISHNDRLPLLFRHGAVKVGAFKAVHDLYRIQTEDIQYLDYPLLHYSFSDVNDLIKKTSFYTKIQAAEEYSQNPSLSRLVIFWRIFFSWIPLFIYTLVVKRNYRTLEWVLYSLNCAISEVYRMMYYLEMRADNSNKN